MKQSHRAEAEVGRNRRFVVVVGLAAGVALALGSSSWVYAGRLADSDARSYQAALALVRADLSSARRSGFSTQDLLAIDSALQQVITRRPPTLVWMRPDFYTTQAGAISSLETQMGRRESAIILGARAQLEALTAQIATAVDQDRSLGVPSAETDQLSQELAGVAGSPDRTIAQLRSEMRTARALADQVQAAGQAQAQTNLAIQQAASSLLAEASTNPAALRAAGESALDAGRNDATVAAYENLAGRFPAAAPMTDAYAELERSAAQITATDPHTLADAVAGLQHYAQAIHGLLLQNLGPQHIVVSFQSQHVWVYQGTQLVMDSPVTTGIRGVTDYGTDFGPMKVLSKSHPWTFRSPYPRGSPYWYPNTVVQWTVFFTDSGESFHDAYWEADSQLGPGSQFNPATRSHGCIHLPYARAEWLFGWANLGTPVDVIPGDGQPVAAQMAEITTDSHGNPLSPA